MPESNSGKSEHPLNGKGLLFSYDPRDDQFPMFATPPPLTDTMRHSWRLGKILDQGRTSACVGYSWSQFLQSDPWRFETNNVDYGLQVYRDAQEIDEWPGREPQYYGTSIRAGANVLKERGLIKGYVWGKTINDIARFVNDRGPVIMGTKWFQDMAVPDPSGFARPTGAYEGGHAWMVYGVDVQWETFMCANSWGNTYGRNGRFFVRFKDMEKLMADGGQACSALEK